MIWTLTVRKHWLDILIKIRLKIRESDFGQTKTSELECGTVINIVANQTQSERSLKNAPPGWDELLQSGFMCMDGTFR